MTVAKLIQMLQNYNSQHEVVVSAPYNLDKLVVKQVFADNMRENVVLFVDIAS